MTGNSADTLAIFNDVTARSAKSTDRSIQAEQQYEITEAVIKLVRLGLLEDAH